jgi:HPt (histidine-containing phosphotransfer) domain-containing protein
LLWAVLERSKLAVQNRIDPATTFANGSVSGSKSDAVDAVGTKTSALPRTQEECPVQMQRLMELSDDDPEQLRELVSLFLAQSEDLINKLGAAIQSGSAKELTELAHNYGGDCASCGMTVIVAPLQKLERMGRSGLLSGAEQSYADVRKQLSRIQQFLTCYLQEM